jgi:hypothetical protein
MLLSKGGYEGGKGDEGPAERGPPKPGGRDIRRSTEPDRFPMDDIDMLCDEHSPLGLRCLC